MKIAVPVRHRRLLALCAGSALLHLALLDLVARHGTGASARLATPGGDLVLRLAPLPLPAPVPPAPARPASAAPPPAATPGTPAPARRAIRGQAATLPDAPPPVAGAAAGTAAGSPAADMPAPPPVQMPGRYRVRIPDAAVLAYARSVERPGMAPAAAGTARLDWRTDGRQYRIDMDGVLGRLHSEGTVGDAGIVPRRAVETRGRAVLVTEFDDDGNRVLFRASGREAPGSVGIQDPASLLLQLAGIGLGEPDQVQDRIDVVVADSAQARVARFQVMETEDIDTGLGTIAAVRLAQVAAPGQPRLDVWLSPGHGWLPVRIRLSSPDGSTATETLTALDPPR